MRMHDSGELLVAAVEGHGVDELGDHVARPVADNMRPEDLAELGVDDQFDEPIAIVVDGGGALATQLLAADLDVVPGLLGLRLRQADARDLRLAEGGAGYEVLVDRMGVDAGGVLNGHHALLGGFVGERLAPDKIADGVDLWIRRLEVLVDLDLAAI